jgi:hypothetical protein
MTEDAFDRVPGQLRHRRIYVDNRVIVSPGIAKHYAFGRRIEKRTQDLRIGLHGRTDLERS